MLEHRGPFDQLSTRRGPAAIDTPALRVVPVSRRGLLLMQADPADAGFQDAVRVSAGVAGLPAPQCAAAGDQCALLWLGPREFLLDLAAERAARVLAAVLARLGAALAAATDVSDAFAGFDIAGEAAADALAAGCSLDLRAAAFGPGRVARTALAGVPAVIWKSADPRTFRCLVERGFADHLWRWLAQTAASGCAGLVLADRGAARP